ncbi:hypothetical protein KIH87_03875 [Paraneptunicella aestuarii]|uniref:acyl-CoA reductase n=1 Tax=Paraneptunicella aestuarii TaxID=2831148 RepID=UPI001E45B195|nr:acyl-CoA reductase [Paraneptunicella aestuarii]UAA39504.1 hypothetical protein KIH87_03875 [Paraneptunicella aestuarii]
MTLISQSKQLIEYLTPSSVADVINDGDSCPAHCLLQQAPLSPFSEDILAFLKAFSKKLLKRSEPELVALGFWLRESRLKQFQSRMQVSQDDVFIQPIGRVLHFTPANVDTMFVYSWVCSLLMGNVNLVRLSSQESPLKQALLALINELYLLPEFHPIAKRNGFIYYPHDDTTTALLSANADARVLWGGDEAVMAIRHISAKPRTRDISFADRYSLSLIDVAKLDSKETIQSVAEKLWRDTIPFGQMACSSPKAIVWLGEDENGDKHVSNLTELLEAINQHALQEAREISQKNNHLITSQLAQAWGLAGNVRFSDAITALDITEISEQIFNWHTGSGLYFLLHINSLQELPEFLEERCQTVSVWGIDHKELIKLFATTPITAVDRIVPIGQALDFDPVWDGYDLLQQLSRKITIQT